MEHDLVEWNHPAAGCWFGQLFAHRCQFHDLVKQGHGKVWCHCACGNDFASVGLGALVRGEVKHCGGPAHRATYAVLAPLARMVKIGSSRSVAGRFRSLQCMSPVPLQLIGTCADNVEMALHERLSRWRSHGEWFHFDDEVADVVADVLRGTLTGSESDD